MASSEAEKIRGEVIDTPDEQTVKALPCAKVGNRDRESVGWGPYLVNIQEWSRPSG